MKVLYDYQGFMQRHGGVSRYFVELIQAMEAVGGFEAAIPLFFTDNQYLSRKRIFLTRQHFKGKVRLMSALNKAVSLRSFSSSYDLFHPTYFQPYFLSHLKSPFVITIHDMTHHLFNETQVRDDGTRENMRVLCEHSAKIIAVSNATKTDVCRLLAIPDSKVAVIHHGTNLRYEGGPRLHSRPYILHVGDRDGYKNFAFFLSSVAGFLQEAGLDLVCVGSRPFSSAEHRLLNSTGIQNQVRRIEVSTSQELASLYHCASAFCYPSLYEGFGMPLLEAFSSGCPVVASRIPAFCEIAGDAAEYFDPQDASSIASSLRNVVSNPKRAYELVQSGYERVRLYSWERAARSTLEVYRSAL